MLKINFENIYVYTKRARNNCIILFALFAVLWIYYKFDYRSETFQSYAIINENWESLLTKIKKLQAEDASLYANMKKDSTIKMRENLMASSPSYLFLDKSSLTDMNVRFAFVKFYLKDVKRNVYVRINNINGFIVDLKCPSYYGRSMFEYGSSYEEIKEDMRISKSFEDNVLKKICIYRKKYHVVPIIWVACWFEENYKVLSYILISLILLSFALYIFKIFKKVYYRFLHNNRVEL